MGATRSAGSWVVALLGFLGACGGKSTSAPVASGDDGSADAASGGSAVSTDGSEQGASGGGAGGSAGDSGGEGGSRSSSVPDGSGGALKCDAFGCDGDGGPSGFCQAPYECRGRELSSCTDGLTRPVEICASAALCDAERGECVEPSCDAHELRCNGSVLETCAQDRSGFVDVLDCGDAAACDAENGSCVVEDCDPGAFQCENSVLMVCGNTGTTLEMVEDCADHALCDAEAGRCGSASCGNAEDDCEELTGGLDGRLVMLPCADSPSTDDCNWSGAYFDGELHQCAQGMLEANIQNDIGGTLGTSYLATVHVYGIVEPKNYGSGITRDAETGRPDLNGGTPTPWASAPGGHEYPGSNYATYELRVQDDYGSEVGVYYLNSDTQEGHYTMILDYEKTIVIVGGGAVVFRTIDNNCRGIKNCGSAGGYPCDEKARVIDISEADPQPPLGDPPALDQPGLGKSADDAGQWVFIDVLTVEPM